MKRSSVFFPVLVLLLATAVPGFAGTTGKIAGKVMDTQSGEPLVPASIILEGTVLGGVSNDQGEYFIINVPPGSYSVTAKMIGYQDVRKQNVQVFPDFTTEVSFDMQAIAFELGEAIEVVQERPLIQPDRTATATFITAEDIGALPVRGYQAAAAVQSGVVDFDQDLGLLDNTTEESRNGSTLIVRGGRPNQVGYFVDGFLQQDPLTGISSTSINSNAISEVVFLKGGFESEYGRFQSGIVNVITKEGEDEIFGSLEAITDNLELGTNPSDYNIYAGTLGGPMFGEHTFFASGERRWSRDRDPSAMTAEVADLLQESLGAGEITSFEQDAIDSYADKRLPSNSLNGWNWQGKLNFKLGDANKLLLGTQGSIDKWQQYRHSYLFNREHAPRYEDRNFSGFARYTQNVSTSTFYNAGFNLYHTERKRGDGVHFDQLTAYARPNGNPRFEDYGVLFFNEDDPTTPIERSSFGVILDGEEGHVFDDYLRRISSYMGGYFDMTRQLDRYNQVKFGGDFRRHALRRYQHFFPRNLYDENRQFDNVLDVDHYGFDLDGVDPNDAQPLDGEKHPIEFSAFFQDKVEYEGLVLKAGLRYDYFDADTQGLLSQENPLDADPTASGAVAGRLDDSDLSANKKYHRVSPRLGVAFPVSSSTNLHFNYGKFFQPPTLENLYVSYKFLEHKVLTGGYFVDFGNPNLEPEETTAYEVGMSQAVGDGAKVDVTAYYKTVKDLIQVRNITTSGGTSKAYASYLNTDFGTVKGVDFDYTLRRRNRVQASLNYSLSFADGTGALPGTQRDIAWTAGDPPKQTFPLDFDQRHKATFNLDYRFGDDDGPQWGETRPFEDFGVNVLFNVASGTPFTPANIHNEVTLGNLAAQPNGSVNSRYGPWTYRIDLKADKGFGLGGLDWNAYVWVLNLLDRDNATQVYTSSGSAETTLFLTTPDGQAFAADPQLANSDADGASFYNIKELNPLNFSLPRQVRFGLKANF